MNDDVRSRRVTRRGTIDTDVEVAFTTDATVAELAAALGLGLPLTIDGASHTGERLLAQLPFANGSIVGEVAPVRPVAPGPVLHQIAGLSAGGNTGLRAGRFAVGANGPQRAELRVASVASARFTVDVTTPGPVMVSAESSERVVIDGESLVVPIEVGNRWIDADGAVFRVSPGAAAQSNPPVGADGTHRRATEPRITPARPAAVTIPEPLIGVSKRAARRLVGLQVATAIQLQEARRRMLQFSRHASPDVAELSARLDTNILLWERSAGDGDAWLVNVGIGNNSWNPVDDWATVPAELAQVVRDASMLPDVPLILDLRNHAAVNLIGPRHATTAIARWLVVQLGVLLGPESCVLDVRTDHFAAWDWMKWLPHLDGSGQRLVVVHDGGHAPAVRAQQTVLSLHDGGAPLDGPTIEVTADGRVTVTVNDSERGAGTAVGLSQGRALVSARRLARFHRGAEGRLPNRVGLGGLLGFDDPVRLPEQISERWQLHADRPEAVVGRTGDGPAALDLTRPIFITGRGGSGRRTALRTIALTLAASNAPEQLSLALISPSTETFVGLDSLPHVWHSGPDLPRDRPPSGRAVLLFDEVASVLAADPLGRETLQQLWNAGVALVLANRFSPGLLTSGVIPVGAHRVVLHHDSNQMAIDSSGGCTIDDQRTAVAGRAWLVTGDEPQLLQFAIADSLPARSTDHIRITAFSLIERTESTSGLDRRTLTRWATAIHEAARHSGSLSRS